MNEPKYDFTVLTGTWKIDPRSWPPKWICEDFKVITAEEWYERGEKEKE